MKSSIAYRPTTAVISLDHLRHNISQILERCPKNILLLPVIKADAYGHGAKMVGQTLERMGIKQIAVATVEEGIELRDAGIRAKLIVLGGLMGAQAEVFLNYQLSPVLHSFEDLRCFGGHLKTSSREYAVHLKLDSGMGRLGFLPSDIEKLIQELKSFPQMQVETIMTHLARADEDDPQPTDRQFILFGRLQKIFLEGLVKAPLFHIANSSAILDGRVEGATMVRPGLMIYGATPAVRHHASILLKPVLTLKTKILEIKNFLKGAAISYGGTFVCERDSRIAVLPLGYADGYPRRLSNRAQVLVQGKRVPVVGRVCMDLTMIDVTDLISAQIGDEVVLIGSQGDEQISAVELADWAETISYEIFCGISARVPRVYEGL